MMESPDEASAMACPIVLQAVVGDLQLLPSLSLTPFTYLVVLADAFAQRLGNTKAQTTDCSI